jgi:transcriptional regulator with XRE-family HTH domain
MTVASRILRQCRRSSSLTQSALAERIGFRQSNIARIESESRDVCVETLSRLVRSAGYRLTVSPSFGATAAEAADTVAEFLVIGNEDGAYRTVIQLADDLAREHGAERVGLTIAPPPATRDERYDAFIAGVVEVRLAEEGLPHPKWLIEGIPLVDLWFVDEWSVGNPATIASTPLPLRRRGVIVDAAELESV